MVVPVDTTVTLDIKAQDVAHSWWIPKLGGKFDAVPGYTNHTWFKIPGKFAANGGTVFYGQCAELCGRNHANMTARVKAVSVEEYQRWLDQRKADIKAAEDAAAKQRQQLQGGTTP
jgi:cytochrome c oxidase subunit 2